MDEPVWYTIADETDGIQYELVKWSNPSECRCVVVKDGAGKTRVAFECQVRSECASQR